MRYLQCFLAILTLFVSVSSYATTTCESTTTTWFKRAGVACIGTPGTTITVTWQTATGPVTVMGTIAATGRANIEAPTTVSEGDSWTVVDNSNPPCNENGVQLAALMTPDNAALASHEVTGGIITLDGQSFLLSGSFEVIADESFDTDLSGLVPAESFNISGESASSSDTVQIQILQDIPYSVDLTEALSEGFGDPAGTNFEIPLEGFLILNDSIQIPFTGMAQGFSTYNIGPNSPEFYAISLDLNTDAGDATGNLNSAGILALFDPNSTGLPQTVNVPMPSWFYIAFIASIILLTIRKQLKN